MDGPSKCFGMLAGFGSERREAVGILGGGGVCAGVPGKLKSEDGGGNGDGGEDGGTAAISAGFRR